MQALAPIPDDVLIQLDGLAKSDRLPAREAARCAHLVETLRRPARVCLLGHDAAVLRAVLAALLADHASLAEDPLPPALELRHGPALRAVLTLEDGTILNHDGAPTAELMRQGPMFMQLDLPGDLLADMSVLILMLDRDPSLHRPALSWAARRTEIAVWCTARFTRLDAQIWAHVPQRLSHHAYLAETRPDLADPVVREEFTGQVTLPLDADCGTDRGVVDLAPLLACLTADIVDGRLADVDSAQMLLHRLGHLHPVSRSDEGETRTAEQRPARPEWAKLRRHLSEPLLYLQRRAKALADDLAWAEAEGEEGWADVVRTGCAETAEGVRDRALGWPDDFPELVRLSALVDDICDAFLLLEPGGGADQAQDAAALLYQLRREIERTFSTAGGQK